jgi:hypothetical protein
MIILIWPGSMIGKRRANATPKENSENTTILAALFGLFAFLLAFTFSMNINRRKIRGTDPIVSMLFALALLSSFFIGYYSSRSGWFDLLIAFGFCLLSAMVIYITLDLDRSRSGLIRHRVSHSAIQDLISMFEKPWGRLAYNGIAYPNYLS